ncbi:sulfotransferase-like domain-containing protein [Neptunicoccus cionae]|uniref:Branched chain amino acid aminotransferase n=1 Tax=Neptunicoccus cionae TaxID=2035344 RepID=A0A916VQ08_9RHOB|nr:HAD family hydrolase [Amylibacter cionae]GGA17961.1 branched chain amino acid aminotransferase [Amylibacter cionae]
MWSGPRNLSTAMMYSFAQRPDTEVWDEPFYAAYLKATGLDHPMGAEIQAAGERDPDAVINACTGAGPLGKSVFYQKHMTQHMIDGVDRSWVKRMTNVFLIRDPARVLASYDKKRGNPTLDDIGFRQQAELIDLVCEVDGRAPIVIDSADIREAPETMLRLLCQNLSIPFDPKMLSWPKGGNPQDGVWAPHWYGAVWNSTGFAGAEGPLPDVSEHLKHVLEQAQEIYDRIAPLKLKS